MTPETKLPNGPIAAAILSAAIGCFTLGLTTLASDKSKPINAFMNFYPPSGALTGETTIAILLWIAAWLLLGRLWRNKSISVRAINLTAATLLIAALLLTFPPFIDAL